MWPFSKKEKMWIAKSGGRGSGVTIYNYALSQDEIRERYYISRFFRRLFDDGWEIIVAEKDS